MIPSPQRFLFATAVLLLLGSAAAPDTPPVAEQQQKLTTLLRERRAVVREMLKAREQEYLAGRHTLEVFTELSGELLRAELALAEQPAERVAQYERHVKQMQEGEKVERARFEAGRVGRHHYLESKARLLDAEIGLLRERMGGQATAADKARLQQALRERREAWREAIPARVQELEVGRLLAQDFVEAARHLLLAELEAADKPAERVAACQSHFDRLGKCEELAKKSFDAGRLPVSVYAWARAARLEAEIGLLREQADATGAAADGARIKALLTQRRDTCREVFTAVQKQYEAGQVSSERICDVSRTLLHAELAVADTPAERIALHEKHLATARAMAAVTKGRYEAGRISFYDHGLMQAARLDAEIELLRAQLPRKAPGK